MLFGKTLDVSDTAVGYTYLARNASRLNLLAFS